MPIVQEKLNHSSSKNPTVPKSSHYNTTDYTNPSMMDTLNLSDLHIGRSLKRSGPVNVSSLSPDGLSQQATLNIGTIGHVAHGKSTLVRAITGIKTMKYKAEMARNITIKLGYANAKIYKCSSSKCPRPGCYNSCGSNQDLSEQRCKRESCEGRYEFVRCVSFVDCPGHDILMRTMLAGASVMDAALLLVSANEACPQPQTIEHLAAIEAMNLPSKAITIVQNKIDLVGQTAALKHATEIKEFLNGTCAEDAALIPTSAQFHLNIDAVLDSLANIPQPIRDLDAPPRMTVVRSFDVNRPGFGIDDLKGGVAGGSILRGVLRLNNEIEVRPGLIYHDSKTEKSTYRPLYSRVTSLFAESQNLSYAIPGGLIAVGTLLAPELCRGDRLVGHVLGLRDTLPPVFVSLLVRFHLLQRVVGGENQHGGVTPIRKGDALMLNVGSLTVGCRVTKVKDDVALFGLTQPVCTDTGEKVALSRKDGKSWRLVGWGFVLSGEEGGEVERCVTLSL